jgi:hypothetical protein
LQYGTGIVTGQVKVSGAEGGPCSQSVNWSN